MCLTCDVLAACSGAAACQQNSAALTADHAGRGGLCLCLAADCSLLPYMHSSLTVRCALRSTGSRPCGRHLDTQPTAAGHPLLPSPTGPASWTASSRPTAVTPPSLTCWWTPPLGQTWQQEQQHGGVWWRWRLAAACPSQVGGGVGGWRERRCWEAHVLVRLGRALHQIVLHASCLTSLRKTPHPYSLKQLSSCPSTLASPHRPTSPHCLCSLPPPPPRPPPSLLPSPRCRHDGQPVLL
jgi:hypothetical protein